MSSIRLVLALSALALVAASAPSPARAADPAPAPGPAEEGAGVIGGACSADVARLCGDVPAGGGARARCLRSKSAEASPACRAQMDPAQQERRRERLAEAQAACHDDVDKLCADVRPGGGAIVRCLRGHADQLSPGCSKAMAPPAP